MSGASDDLLAGLTPLTDFDAPWKTPLQGKRLRTMRAAAERVRDRFASGPRVVAVRTMDRVRSPYPTKYAFWGAAFSPMPFVMLTHRCMLVQFFQRGALKHLLFNPTDVEAARRTPYFARLIEQFKTIVPLIAKEFEPLEKQLEGFGITPPDIDYLAFDHFHIQDLRTLLGTVDGKHAPRFPNAVLLAPKNEWDDWDDLHPLQQAFFIRDGKEGVRTDKVAFTSGDLALGDGVMLVRSPGHTCGNQTLFVHTEAGVWGTSENGTCADAWSPLESHIPGLASTCRRHDIDLALNSNTPECLADQYASMVMERTIVDRVKRAPAFVQMVPSSEITPGVLAPGLSPTIVHGTLSLGALTKPASRRAAGAPRSAADGRVAAATRP